MGKEWKDFNLQDTRIIFILKPCHETTLHCSTIDFLAKEFGQGWIEYDGNFTQTLLEFEMHVALNVLSLNGEKSLAKA